ncbi:precorrin-8X methylmutase [Haloglycomyces albus]|uniref:precorrin-8X methylmutase n=1 Tax=Haloglycomyces albus TaxID=526067 RepID=UPI00046CBC4F|nr:precorrin-8X methylmutase [Haloglycomyces albus]
MGRDVVHEIEKESMRRLRKRCDLSHLPPLSRAITERIVHSAADVRYAEELVMNEPNLAAAWEALANGAPIVADSRMVAAGITSTEVHVPLQNAEIPDLAHRWGLTRSAAAIRWAADHVDDGAVWVVGNAPTALEAILSYVKNPSLVVGLPVGFVGAVESKEALRESPLPAVSNMSELGGSAVAASCVNALLYIDRSQKEGA